MFNISQRKIEKHLTTSVFGRNIRHMKVCTSTNEEAKLHCDSPDGTLFIADTQTCGRGRLGRSWESEKGGGIYMSLLLKPDIPAEVAPQLTLVAGIAVCKALGNAKIKWPNDIIIGNKKVCGILTEMSHKNVICGIGINANTKKFPAELDFATSLYLERGRKVRKEKIVADVLNIFEILCNEFYENGFDPLLDEYKTLCENIGKDVRVIFENKEVTGVATDVSANGNLLVKTTDGEISVASGEVSVRGLYKYI